MQFPSMALKHNVQFPSMALKHNVQLQCLIFLATISLIGVNIMAKHSNCHEPNLNVLCCHHCYSFNLACCPSHSLQSSFASTSKMMSRCSHLVQFFHLQSVSFHLLVAGSFLWVFVVVHSYKHNETTTPQGWSTRTFSQDNNTTVVPTHLHVVEGLLK